MRPWSTARKATSSSSASTCTLGKSTFDRARRRRGHEGRQGQARCRQRQEQLRQPRRVAAARQQGRPAAGRRHADHRCGDWTCRKARSRCSSALALEGSVRAERVKFTNDAVQDKIDELSRKAQGRPTDAIDRRSRVADGDEVRAPRRRVHLSGTVVRRAGRVSARSTARTRCDRRRWIFAGVVLLNATVSQTQTGFRSWLLKPFDPLFRKNGAGTRLVITVAGTQDQPKIGLASRTDAQRRSSPLAARDRIETMNSPALSARSSSFTAR